MFLQILLLITTTLAQLDNSLSDVWTIPKCCPLGYGLGEKDRAANSCIATNLTLNPEYWGVMDTTNSTEVDVIVGDPCPYGKYRLEPEKDSTDEFHLMKNGSLLLPFLFDGLLNTSEYCVEVFDTAQGPLVFPLLCFPPPVTEDSWKSIAMVVYPIGLLLSVPFLLVTLLIYGLIPELRDTQGKTLCCHISCLIVAYITLATVQLGITALSGRICVYLGFVIQFSFLACFFWLNVLCFDTWWRITSPLSYCSYNAEVRRFLWYSLYAWILPLLLLTYSLVKELTPIIPPSYFKPGQGYSCWFANEDSALQYFYGPMGFILVTNIVLFFLSARHIPEYAIQTNQTQTSLQTNERTARRRTIEMFRKCAELFVVMGLNWIMELISWAFGGPSLVWFATDVINTLQGIIIFFIFVIQVPRVRNLAVQYAGSLCNYF